MHLSLAALALAASPTQRLSTFDLAIIAVYLLGITLFGLRFRKSSAGASADRSLKSYFLANRTIPWWAIALSVVSAETSTLTIVSIPGVAFAGDFGFLQIVIGYMLGRVVVAILFLPRYLAGEMLTAYQLIDRRFGPVLHKITAGLFLLTRAAAEGVRVFAVSIVVGVAIGTRDVLSIAIISALTLLYTFEGGMAAVIWTDVVQMAIYVAGTIVAVFTLGSHVSGGWLEIHTIAAAAGKFHMFNFAFNLTQSYTFWAGVLGGTFLTMASHGTDQLMVQRLLAARNLRESRLALLSSGVVIFFQFALFLLIGVGLYVFYHQHAGTTFRTNDYIFPTFIVREMPIGVAGLLIAAILAAAMSNLSAALNSLSSTTVVDFYMTFRPAADERERGIISKSSTVVWALALFAIAVYSVSVGGKGHVVEIGLSIASVAYGCLLGVFLLGTLTRYATQIGASIGMVCGFVLNVWLWQGSFPKQFFQTGPKLVDCQVAGYMRFSCPSPTFLVTVPKIAFTWFVLIGALVTFAIGSLASLIFRKQSRRTISVAASLLLLFLLSFPQGTCFSASAQSQGAPFIAHASRAMGGVTTQSAPASTPPSGPLALGPGPSSPDFTQVSTLINDAIAAHKLPGAVVVIGHGGKVVFHQAYGNRKLAGEPGLGGNPSPAEPMTEDTIFDMASLTKCLATATAVMQLYEQGKIASFDDPVQKYLPDFNSANDPQRAKVTLRMLLTHTSGEAPDVNLKDPWGLAAPDKAEGIHRALTTHLAGAPGEKFVYSDINFILLGALVEKLINFPEDLYAKVRIFIPLGMKQTAYRPIGPCNPYQENHSLIAPSDLCASWCADNKPCSPSVSNIAPTAHDDESKTNPPANPKFDTLLRGVVHDPTTRRMGGVAGHAGVFSTGHDVSLFAQALLDRLAGRPSNFPLKQSTLELMTTPEQPDHNPQQLVAANKAAQASIAEGEKPVESGLAPHYPAIKGQDLRAFGWDIDTAFSKPRGMVFPIGSFGHTGFTGTSLWMDPGSDTYVVLLANAIHPRGGAPISNLRGEVATAAAQALHLYGSCRLHEICDIAVTAGSADVDVEAPTSKNMIAHTQRDPCSKEALEANPRLNCDEILPSQTTVETISESTTATIPLHTLTGIDVLESTHFAALTTLAAQHNNALRLGLLTNQSGLDSQGRRTVDILHSLPTPNIQLTALFSPEHGIFGQHDTEKFAAETDTATGLHVTSLFGPHDSDKRPSHDQLKDLHAVVIDLQDAGVHFWTYESVLGYFLEASAKEQTEFHHRLDIVVLDRPNPIGGVDAQGPMVDANHTSYVAYMPMTPLRHGLTYGELARYINGEKHLNAPLTVVATQNWSRSEYFADTGLTWVNPSPNLRSPETNIVYPALGMTEYANISVGRGTDAPFSFFGAGIPPKDKKTGEQPPAWFNAKDVATYLTARHIPGVAFTASTMPIAEDLNHYPFHGQTIEAVKVNLTERNALDSPELGIEILAALHHLYPAQFRLALVMPLVANQGTMDAIAHGDDPRTIAATWRASLDQFNATRAQYLLYK